MLELRNRIEKKQGIETRRYFCSLHDHDDGGRHEAELAERLVVVVERENLLGEVGHQVDGSVPVDNDVVAVKLDVKSNGGKRLLGVKGLKGRTKNVGSGLLSSSGCPLMVQEVYQDFG